MPAHAYGRVVGLEGLQPPFVVDHLFLQRPLMLRVDLNVAVALRPPAGAAPAARGCSRRG
jgi:hypothetical protein